MELSCSPEIRQTHELSPEQKVQVEEYSLALRVELIQKLRDERYEPKGVCPKCSRKLSPIEIIRGFNQDPNDFTTCCSACHYRFEPTLVCFGKAVNMELPFYCDCQTLEKLRGKEILETEQLAREHPVIYRSAIMHHGSIRGAFRKIGIHYDFEKISDWKNKILPFLGRLPDTIIAECVGISVNVIRNTRRKIGVSRYTKLKILEEIS